MDEDTGGIIIAAEESGGTKKEGFTRFVAWLLLLMDSGASCWGVSGVDVARDGICKVGSGTTGVAAWVGPEEEIVAEDW